MGNITSLPSFETDLAYHSRKTLIKSPHMSSSVKACPPKEYMKIKEMLYFFELTLSFSQDPCKSESLTKLENWYFNFFNV